MWIDYDQFRAARCVGRLHLLIDDWVASGGVRFDQHEQVGLVEIVVVARYDVFVECTDMVGYCARYVELGIGVDIVGVDEVFYQFVGDIIIFC